MGTNMPSDARNYKKRPLTVTAVQLEWHNRDEVAQWSGALLPTFAPGETADGHIILRNHNGANRADVGDWIVCGLQGEFYRVREGFFSDLYELEGQ